MTVTNLHSMTAGGQIILKNYMPNGTKAAANTVNVATAATTATVAITAATAAIAADPTTIVPAAVATTISTNTKRLQ